MNQALLRDGEVNASSPSLAALQAHGSTPAAVNQLLADHAVPLVEEAACTFLWRGDADAVAVEHRVVGLTPQIPLQRLPDTDLWCSTIELPHGYRMEYRLLVRRGDTFENVLDPLNPRVAIGPAGEMSVLEAVGYVTPDWTEHDPEAPPGRITEVFMASRALRRKAAVTVYAPAAVQPERRYPLLVMHDGADFLMYSGAGTVLDNLIHRRLIAECFVVFTAPRDRMREYTAGATHSRFINTELVPELERTLPLRADARSRVLAGASLGAVASLAAAVRAPAMYGGLLLESGSFRSNLPGGAAGAPAGIAPALRFVRSVRAKPIRVAQRIFQTYGVFEPLADANRAMTPVLRRMADEVCVIEGLDGHSWTNWRDRLLDGLSWLLPPEPS